MINGERVLQARELSKLTQTELARKIGVKQATIAWIESGKRQPGNEVLEGIAFQTGFPPAFFRQPSSAEFPLGSLLFRARKAMTPREEREAHQYARTIYEQHSFLASRIRSIPVSVPRLTEDPAICARLCRSALGLSPDTPVGNLIRAIEKCGVVVLALPKALPHRDAFSAWVESDGLLPVIVVAATESGDRLRFSVAHELGHLVMHYAIRADIATLEAEADRFASALLMPEEAMRRELTPPVTISSLTNLKARWKVSIQALARRAFDLNIITSTQHRYLMQQISKRGWRTEEPLPIPIERPRALRKMAELVYGVPIDYRKLARAVNHPVSLVRETLEAHAGKGELMHKGKDSDLPKVTILQEFRQRTSD